MLIVDVVAGLLAMALAIVATAAEIVGLLGALGAARLVRCESCGRMVLAAGPAPGSTHAYCRAEHHGHVAALRRHRTGEPREVADQVRSAA